MKYLPILLALPLAACGSSDPCGSKGEAYTMSQTFIKKRLRSPSTADFPSILDASVTQFQSAKGCAYRVSTHVDAQNAFGGTAREYFTVELRRTAPRNWQLIGIR